ncbi:MAG: ATP-binding protein [Candidatus Bathyarchaeota archaeon]|nr:ATP-binding protein [Candidatus Bathyarchaeota archaeon]
MAKLESDGSNLEEHLEYCLLCCSERLVAVSEMFKEIFRSKIEIKKPRKGSQPDDTNIVVKLGDGEEWFPLEKLSDGMLFGLKTILQLSSCCPGDILTIDEPESHLHPGAAKSLREVLFKRKHDIQIICATHSPIFIDPSYVDTIFLHTNERVRNISGKEIDLALREIGSNGLDAILYDAIIWYEGPADKEYICKWLQFFVDDIKMASTNIGLIHFGGKGNLEFLEPETIKKIARKSLFIIDLDNIEKDKNKELLMTFTNKCKASGIKTWVLKRKEIENYIPRDILSEVLHIPKEELEQKTDEEVIKKIKERGRKTTIAKSICEKILKEDIEKDEEFMNELKMNFIDNLNSFYDI